MRTAVISDIHGNLEALTSVEHSIALEKPDRIVCLGDIVGYGADPGACIDRIRSMCSVVVLGNHDAASIEPSLAERFSSMAAEAIVWTRTVLSHDQLTYLRGLPLVHSDGDLLFVHASPLDPSQWTYIVDTIDARLALPAFTQSVCFIGHTHVPAIFRDRRAKGAIRLGEQIIVNVGSVGQPRDGHPEASYGLFDDQKWEYRNVRVPYDIDTAVRKIREAGLPSRLADRLIVGL